MKILRTYNDYSNKLFEAKKRFSFLTEKEWFAAVLNNDIKKVKSFIDNGIDINIVSDEDEENLDGGIGKCSALIWAADKGFIDIVKLLLTHPNINVNDIDHLGWTALIFAAFDNNPEIVKLLLTHPNINVNKKDYDEGYTALLFAAEYEHKEVIMLLLSDTRIDISIKGHNDKGLLDVADESFFKDYDIQKCVIKNSPDSIKMFIKKDLVHPKIAKEYPHIFSAADLDLL